MIRPLALFVIGAFLGAGVGYFAAIPPAPSHDHASHTDMAHDHTVMAQWDPSLPAPTIALETTADMGADLNLHIITTGFTFAPEQVNGPVTPGTGHAHIYVNGVKFARAYSPWMQVTDVPEGATIRVTLNANDHAAYAIGNTPIAAEITP